MIYTVNRFYRDASPNVQKKTAKVVLSLSNRGPDDAEKYGKLIERKGVPGGVWRFVGTIDSDVPFKDVHRVVAIGGADDTVVLRRLGIDVRRLK